MHPRLLTLACHLPAVAWGTAAPDDAIDALVGSGARGTTGQLVLDLVADLRDLAARHPDTSAAEMYSLLPVAPGDLSALPRHAELSALVTRCGGGLLLRNPSSDDVRVVMHAQGAGGGWVVEDLAGVPMAPQPDSVSAATAHLTDAVHQAAAIIAAARQSGRHLDSTDVPGMPESAHHPLPRALESREMSLLDRADSVEQIRAMANAAEARGGAVAEQQPQLWGLQIAVNGARRAVVASLATRLLAQTQRVRTAD